LNDATSGNILNLDAQTIIAESGVSDLTIDKVEFHSICVPSIEAGTGTQTIVKFEIMEPAGAGLIDKLYYQATALGIGNWMVMPCFLQLEFRGRNPDTSSSDIDGASGGLGSLKWVWPVKLTTAKANVTKMGTLYQFDAIFYSELGQSNSYFNIQHNVVLKKLKTFRDAMTELEDKLNADQFEKLIDNYSIPDTYKIIIDPAFADKPITLTPSNKNTSRGNDYLDFEKKTATYNAGTSIDKIVDSLCGSMDYFQQKLQSSNTPDAQPNSINQEPTQMKTLWRVITETKPIAYDALRQDNAVEVTIYIVEYDIGILDIDAAQTGQTPDTINAAKKRFAEYAKRKILNKKYNYIFTGLNDQILELDLNMNFSFISTLSRFGGIYSDTATNEYGVVAHNNAETAKNAAEQVRQTLQFVNNATNTQESQDKINNTIQSINAAQLDNDTKQRYIAILNFAKNPDRQSAANQITTAGGIGNASTLSEATRNAVSLAQPLSATNSNGDNINLTFISDVNINSTQAQQTATSYQESLKKEKLRPIAFREGSQEVNLQTGIDPSSNPGRQRTSSIFATALYQGMGDVSLTHLKMKIKGDPYWVFPRNIGKDITIFPYKSNLAPLDAINEIKKAHIQYPNSVNLFGTDNFIVIRFRTPRIYNATSSPTDPFSEVETFSGVYKVIRVVSHFENGKFTQELECIIDPVIDLADFLKDIEDAVKNPDLTIQQTADTTISIPDLSIKTDRISSAENLINGQVATVRNQIGSVVSTAQTTVGKIQGAVSNIPTIIPTPDQAVAQALAAAGIGNI
jgi:hypothetical protein